ncbi:reverse transcriptase domain-containing protein [Bradyrhizobium sp. 33ap4]|uniref:reverse transcriptase domain-containing protein n=1 Tax=Bradyrhizobium sp. 33ap4 TaxID=3061630 RepID=UPI0029307CDA|nr:reverse transcriptase domain-containing protein [Bradyrhizobium sp. 33ap4]
METLRAAYEMAKENDGAPGIDGVTFEAIEARGVESLLEQSRDELIGRSYQPLPSRKREIPKDGGSKVRVLSIPAIRDRVVQGALKLVLEPVFEADFQPGSFGYRPKRTAHEAIKRVAQAIAERKTRILDVYLRAYFDNIRHDRMLEKAALRIDDKEILHLLRLMLKASGKKGVPQGGVISPLLSNLYLNEVDKMLERAREVTRRGKYTNIEYARFADDRAPRRREGGVMESTFEQPCCTADGGWPLELGLQDQGSNHRLLLRPNGRGGERDRKRQSETLSGKDRGDERKRTTDELSKA